MKFLLVFKISCLLAFVLADDEEGHVEVIAADNQQTFVVDLDANFFCQGCFGRRNNKDVYANANDCHSYFQCFFLNETFITGIQRQCPPNMFWRDEILQCVPEGATPCQDRCSNDADTALRGCYADATTCSSYFTCSNGVSYQMCCPLSTRFNESTCSCDLDDTCADFCQRPQIPSATVMPPQSNGTYCRDSFGNILKEIPHLPDRFLVFDMQSEGLERRSYELKCAPGSKFDLTACRCDKLVKVTGEDDVQEQVNKQCRLYLPFEEDDDDHSVSKFATFSYGYTTISHSTFARGKGSLFVDSGWLEIPGLKTMALGKAASWCLFYRCSEGLDPQNPNRCTKYGGLLSNNKDFDSSELSIQIASSPQATIAILRTEKQQGGDSVVFGASMSNATDADINDFTQVCVVYDGEELKLYIDNEVVSSVVAQNGDVKITHCPYVVGTDQVYGDFEGFIDEVLVCDRALSPDEVNAHWQGQGALFAAGLVPTAPSAAAQPDQAQLDEVWRKYKLDYDVTFDDADEEEKARAIFEKRYVMFVEHGRLFSKGQVGFSMQMHSSMHVEWKTMAINKLGLSFATARSSKLKATALAPTLAPTRQPLSENVDWRIQGCVNPIMNQGNCGGCYTFAAAAAIEGQYCYKYKMKLNQLSLQQMLDCTQAYDNDGCNGGTMTGIYDYLIEKKVVIADKDYPFKGFVGVCKAPTIAQNPNQLVPIKIVSYINLPESEDELAKAIALYGTVSCAIDATINFWFYKTGIFSDPVCSNAPNHAINFVGYGCTAMNSAKKCIGTRFFILRNSWGTTWGEKGYMRIARGCKRNCGIVKMCSCVTVG